MALPESFLQELRARSDITDVVSSYVSLKRRGRNMVGLCPFHNEKTPSFNLYPENGSFYCFGCGVGGDVITFVKKIENLDYIDAVKFLAQRAGMNMPENNVDDSLSRLRMRVLEINRETARFFHSCLLSPQGKPGLDYLTRRGLSMATIRHFGLGYSPDSRFELVNHLRKLGYTDQEMSAANVAVISKKGFPFDRFNARVMYPIIDLRGNVVAFGGRILTDEKPKYLNSSDTPVYHKSSGLFALNFAKNEGSDQLLLVEGYMDVISLHQAGIRTAIASLGTALTPEQAKILARYAKEIIVCYDSDEAGQKAAARAIPLLRGAGLLVKVLVVPGNKDPDEFMRSMGKDGPVRFKQLMENSGNDIDYQLQKLKAKYNLETSDGKVRYLTDAAALLSALDNPLEKEVYAGKLAGELSIDSSAILQQVKRLAAQKDRQRQQQAVREQTRAQAGVGDRVNPEKFRNLRAANAEEALLSYLFKNPDSVKLVEQRLKPENFVTAFNRRVYMALTEKMLYSAAPVLGDFAQELTEQELSALARILAKFSEIPQTREDAEACVTALLQESGRMDTQKVQSADAQEIKDYLRKLKESKK